MRGGNVIDFEDEADAVALRDITADVCSTAFAPPPDITVSQWADANRRLSTLSSAEPGRFETDRVPYLRAIQDALGDDTIPEVVCAKSAQVGLSTSDENFIGYSIDQDPSGILVVWPTDKALRNWSTLRLDPLIRETPCLAAKFPRSGRRTSEDAIERKIFPGGYLAALSAKSTSDLRSYSARRAVGEEIDEWDGDVNEQGDPIELLRARIRAFWNGKLFLISTPTLLGSSRIWKELLSSTFHEFYVPCPHCEHFQTLRWLDEEDPIFQHREPGKYRVLYERDAGGELIPGTCRYVCEECEREIPERHLQRMLERGEWRARYPERRYTKMGFHINTLYSPLCPWDKIAQAHQRAVKDRSLMQVFVNTFLGLPYEEKGESVDEHFLRRRAIAFPTRGEELLVPRGVGLLTAGVDVNGDWLDVQIWGWGHEERGWVYKWEQIHGDPGQPDVWRQLDALLTRQWVHQDGARLQVAAAAVDAGYMTEHVWQFCQARVRRNVFAIVGRAGRGRKLIEAPGPDKYKRSKARKRPMHVVGVDTAKDILYRRLAITESDKPGYVEFSNTLDPVYYEQLTGEEIRTVYVNRRPVRVWRPKAGRRVEGQDTALYAMSALYYLGPQVVQQLGVFAERVTEVGKGSLQLPNPAPASWQVLSNGVS